MRLIVISDTHGNFNILHSIVKKHIEDGDAFIFLGDGNWEIGEVKKRFPQITFYSVKGNCDIASNDPAEDMLDVEEYTIKFTHGHTYNVKNGLENLLQSVPCNSGYILLYGHTHENFTGYINGTYIMNPGSPCMPRNSKASYGILDITKSGIVCNIVEIK